MDDKLQHYGILGMRWGVRRSKAQLRRARGPDNNPRRVTKEQYEAEKQRAIRSGDRATIDKWKGRLTKSELQEALDRVDMNQRVKGVAPEKLESGWDKTSKAMAAVGTAVTFAGVLAKGYQLVADANNTFNNKKKLPKLNGTYWEDQKN